MKHLRLVVMGALIGLGLSTFAKLISTNSGSCSVKYRPDTNVSTTTASITAEVAKNVDEQETGLGGRACIGADRGMLFVFDKPASYEFWMKDMKFPIDIVWINENKTVNSVSQNVLPSSYPKTFVGKAPSRYVLELQANRTRSLSITQGTELKFNL
jgi:uncharacterized membrane protein (UPF0127 family)